jgi:hypothetical protein
MRLLPATTTSGKVRPAYAIDLRLSRIFARDPAFHARVAASDLAAYLAVLQRHESILTRSL